MLVSMFMFASTTSPSLLTMCYRVGWEISSEVNINPLGRVTGSTPHQVFSKAFLPSR